MKPDGLEALQNVLGAIIMLAGVVAVMALVLCVTRLFAPREGRRGVPRDDAGPVR
jgi:hypothetical protein